MNIPVQRFKLTSDTKVKLTTVASVLFFSLVIVYNIFVLSNTEILHTWQIFTSVTVALLFLFLFVISIGYAPRRIDLHKNMIYIRRLFGDVKIPYKQVRKIKTVTDDDLGKVVRVMGVAGMFGYFGEFRSDVLGNFNMYTRSRKSLILLEMHKGKPLVISNEPELADTITRRLKIKNH